MSHFKPYYPLTLLLLSSLWYITSCSSGSGDSGSTADLPDFANVILALGIGDIGELGQTAAWGDFNGDGRQDLIVSNTDRITPNVFLFGNNGSSFVDVTIQSGISDLPLRSAAWADFNNDGLLDLVGGIPAVAPAILYENKGGGVFVDVSEDAGITVDGIIGHTIWADYDADGFVDFFQASFGVSFLYHNEGDETFSEVSSDSGLGDFFITNSAVWFDFNNDGFPDLFLANDGLNTLYRNNGNGTFTNITVASGVGGNAGWDSVASCVGDYNNDGFLDLYVVNILDNAPVRNALYRNNGNGTFTDVTLQTGTEDVGDGRTCAWVDFDGDGRIDLFTTNHLNPTKFFRNLGNGEFVDVAVQVGLNTPIDVFAAPWGDFNNDGFMDVFLNGHLGEALMENSGTATNFLVIELVGDGVFTNISAIGSRVEASTSSGSQIREVSGGRGCCEQDMLPVHFGLGDEEEADIRVEWPSGAACVFNNVDVQGGRRFLIFEEGCDMLEL